MRFIFMFIIKFVLKASSVLKDVSTKRNSTCDRPASTKSYAQLMQNCPVDFTTRMGKEIERLKLTQTQRDISKRYARSLRAVGTTTGIYTEEELEDRAVTLTKAKERFGL